jgi:hypothetical protein
MASEVPQAEDLPPRDSNTEENAEEPLPALEEDLAFAIDIGLSRTGDAGSAFHTTNDPNHPLQRTPWTLRKSSALDIRIVCLDVIHGLVGPNSQHFATLIVLECRFDPRKLRRRISTADVELVFSADAPGSRDPVVAAIAPEGRLILEQREQKVSTTYGTHAKVGGEPVPGVGLHAGAKWERTVERTDKDATTVVGSTSIANRTYGDANSAHWTLLENATTKTGIPAAMRVAVLLHRTDEEKFKCVFSLKVKADWKSAMADMGGSTPTDDPVLFDPMQPSTMKLRKFEELELGKVNLDELSDITFTTVVQNSTKTK